MQSLRRPAAGTGMVGEPSRRPGEERVGWTVENVSDRPAGRIEPTGEAVTRLAASARTLATNRMTSDLYANASLRREQHCNLLV